MSIPQTNIVEKLKTNRSISYYKLLNLKDKLRLIDLIYEPNGYTIIGLTKDAYDKLSNKRIKRNFVKTK